ncbi:acetyl-CoA carboxylase carboxyltransferase subunit alpha [Ktedonosporobacter rubrisoli]|uniref:Multifunctional fusion protein n=2 Tax=Ktedonosporobacter rubrisoli TaxID=2509675 RepID=A0A4P6K793_KTERU|nr:acetyl-CoA carboxylase carboxyltransferase subunit alpha [Ktedonosporobacter rubrisoli]
MYENESPVERPAYTRKDVLVKCPHCKALLYVRALENNARVCLECGHHFQLSAFERINSLLDAGSFVETEAHLYSGDPLNFSNQSWTYPEKLHEAQARTGLAEAIITGTGSIAGYALVIAVMDFHFIGGSMGLVVGEKITRAIELAREQLIPLLIVSASGGARMQEGIFSLMQMAKTTIALQRLGAARVPFISLLTHPTTGGVAASFAMLGDVILAEPGALIGFAGPRVIEQFSYKKLPEGTDTSEFMLEHGMLDAIVPRSSLRATLIQLLSIHSLQNTLQFSPPLHPLRWIGTAEKSPVSESVWDRVRIARHLQRPHTADYIRLLCTSFFELRGDRRYGDDPAIIGGVATFLGRTVMFIGQQKGHNTQQNQAHNFGMPHPEGYRKVQRLMRYAEKFRLPVICLIDTPGAFPGLEAEQRGQAQAIAESLMLMASLSVPTVAVIIGEGGSGGALALGFADRVLMLENSIYTVASPEAAAAILWRDNKYAPQAASALRITAPDLLELGVIDGIIPEPLDGAHLDHLITSRLVAERLYQVLTELSAVPVPALLEQRYTKFRQLDQKL